MDESLKAWLRTSPKAASAFDLMCMAWEASAKMEREACELIAISWSDKSYEAEQIAEEIRARKENRDV
jgi:hypothetical protein